MKRAKREINKTLLCGKRLNQTSLIGHLLGETGVQVGILNAQLWLVKF